MNKFEEALDQVKIQLDSLIEDADDVRNKEDLLLFLMHLETDLSHIRKWVTTIEEYGRVK
tara:strand:+ start:2566 stop:2745 length:180 start_codon:yes stop_codon:yes gene_type:complete